VVGSRRGADGLDVPLTPPNPQRVPGKSHGLTYRFFSRPGWDNTAPRAISNSGLITGTNFAVAGFIYDPHTDTFTDATPPGSISTITQGINSFGRITGHGKEPAIGRYGFVWQRETITKGWRELRPFLVRLKIDVVTTARGISDSGVVVGRTNTCNSSATPRSSSRRCLRWRHVTARVERPARC